MRHETHQLFGGARDHRHHQDGEGHAPRERGEMSHRSHQPRPDEDADHDGRRAVQDVRYEPHYPAESPRPVLGEVQAGADPDREADQRGQSDDDPGPDDRVGHAASGLAGGDRVLREEAPVERRRALGDQMPEDEHERQYRHERQRADQRGHRAVH